MNIEIGKWYLTKGGSICRVDSIMENELIKVTSHFTGNSVCVPKEQYVNFVETEEPQTEPGLEIVKIDKNKQKSSKTEKQEDLYKKYPHIIKDSIYKVAITTSQNADVEYVKGVGNRLHKKKIKKNSGGATRCVIKCQTDKCKNTKDIKVQDAFQVQHCDKCKEILKKEKLKLLQQRQKERKNEKR